MRSEKFVLSLFPSLSCVGTVSLSSLVRVANGIGLAGLHRAKAMCLVSLGKTTAASPSEREGKIFPFFKMRGFIKQRDQRKALGVLRG